MFNSNAMTPYSLADIAAVTEGRRNDGLFGGGNSWWIILFLFFFFGWGGNGMGNNLTNNTVDGYILSSDFANIERKIDTVNSGLCDGFYTTGTNMLNGFAGINNAITNGNHAISAQLNQMAANQAACCCETQRALERNAAQIEYDMATQACENRRAVSDATRDILENQNNSTRTILDFLTQDKIASLQAENQNLKMLTSQSHQNSFLLSQLRPNPIPAYVVQNPYATSNMGCYGGCNI